jgi:predicted nucleotidyltransferase
MWICWCRFEGRRLFGHYMGLKLFLEDLLGHRVDLVTDRALGHELRERVVREAIHVA